MEENKNKIILDLCGGTGSWSKPYRDAGYDVRIWTLPYYDVRKWRETKTMKDIDNIYGILAALVSKFLIYGKDLKKLAER